MTSVFICSLTAVIYQPQSLPHTVNNNCLSDYFCYLFFFCLAGFRTVWPGKSAFGWCTDQQAPGPTCTAPGVCRASGQPGETPRRRKGASYWRRLSCGLKWRLPPQFWRQPGWTEDCRGEGKWEETHSSFSHPVTLSFLLVFFKILLLLDLYYFVVTVFLFFIFAFDSLLNH